MINSKLSFPIVVTIVPRELRVVRTKSGDRHLIITLQVEFLSLVDVDPRRCVRRMIIDRHLRGEAPMN